MLSQSLEYAEANVVCLERLEQEIPPVNVSMVSEYS